MVNCSICQDILELRRLNGGADMDCPGAQIIDAQKKGILPEREDLFEFCVTIHLDFYRSLALILKGEWEKHLELENKSNSESPDPLTCHQKLNCLAQGSYFKPETISIFMLFESHRKWASRSGYSQEQFGILVREMILANLHLVANNSAEIKSFADRSKKQKRFLEHISSETTQVFREAKLNWLWMLEDLGDKLIFLESRRLSNAHTQQKWMLIFGDAHIFLRQQTMRVELMQLKNQFIEADPTLSAQVLEKMVQDIAGAMIMALDDLKIELAFAGYPMYPRNDNIMDNMELEKHLTTIKKLLRKIWMRIHPDRLAQHPCYEKLTQEQKLRIRELWDKALCIRPGELRYQEGQIGYEYRSEQVLLDILQKADMILQYAGIDTDTDMIISGETVDEQLSRLEEAIIRISRDINNAVAELKALMEDRAVLEKEAMLNSDLDQREMIRDAMFKKARELETQANLLEMKIEAHISRNRSCS